MRAVLQMLFHLFSSIFKLATFRTVHFELLAFILEMSQYLFICEENLVFLTLDMRTPLESDFHHDIFEFKVGSPEIRLLIARRTFIVQCVMHAPPAIEGVTVFATDRVINDQCADWTAPLLLVFLIYKLYKLKVFEDFFVCGL
jgi:hypothetical protein